ncbi:MAG: PDZ domain-containing protein [Akkermansiaceae bacterium]
MKRNILTAWLVVLPLVAQDLPLQNEQDRAVLRRQSGEVFDVVSPLAQKVGKSVVWIWAGGKRQLCVGTVVGDGSQVLAKWSELAKAGGLPLQCVGAGNVTFDATVSGVFEDEDLALLQLKNSSLRPISFNTRTQPELGRFLIAAGPGDVTLGIGVVSVMERTLRESDQAFVGVGVENHTEGTGVKIRQLADDSPAQKAGLQIGDIILNMNDKIVGSLMEFRAALATLKPGDSVKLVFSRKGNTKTVDLILGSKPVVAQFPQRRLEVMERMGGDISEVRDGFPSVIQTDMVLNPEECGGPVLDLKGDVVGIVAARAGRIRSYVIPAEAIVAMLQRKPVDPALARVQKPQPEPQLSRNREVRPRLQRSDMERMRARMKEMQQLMRQLDDELGGLDR